MAKKYRWLLLFIVLGLFVGVTGGCRPNATAQENEATEIVTVRRGDISTAITAIGSVRAWADVALSFGTAGRVVQVLVEEGRQVRQDDVLIQLDTADLELQVRTTQAGLMAAQARLAQLKTGPRPEEVRAAQGQVDAAQAAIDQAIAQRDQLIGGDSEVLIAQAQLASAQTRVKQMQLQLNQTRAQDPAPDVTIAQIEVERAQIALNDTQDEYNKALDRPWEEQKIRDSWAKQLQQAQLTYRQAQAQLDRATRAQKAFTIGLDVLAAQIEDALASQRATEAQLKQTQDTLEPRKRAAEAAILAAQAQRDIAQAQLDLLVAGAAEADIAVAQAQVDQAQVALDSAKLALDRATLKAPFDGTVSMVNVSPGQYAAPQVPVLTLVDDQRVSIEADVDEADIGWLQVGQEAEITLDAFPEQILSGHVTAILPSGVLDLGVVSYRVIIAVPANDLPLRSGMTVSCQIIKQRSEDVLLVPNNAIWIDSASGKPFVEKQINDEIVPAFIEQGITNDEFSEVLSGLNEGDQVVVRSLSIRDRFREVVTSSMTGK
ncbi:MAG: efflux RND transporter periplasmic adaptor subunit [Anaerolineae bacterium]|nr:efflux RND transporter periplasmic adaptor subunit [Anaerolineae bacterium]